MSEKKFFSFMNNKMLLLAIFVGAVLVGFTTGNVVAQEVKIGDTSGTPFVSFEDAMASGMYEIRLNDGTGKFQIWDMTNSRNAMIVAPNGNIGVGDEASLVQDFVLGCKTGKCNIMTRALDGPAVNVVRTLGGEGEARITIWDDNFAKSGALKFDIKTLDNGTVCLGSSNSEPCMLIFDLKGPNPGQVKQTDGTCIANC